MLLEGSTEVWIGLSDLDNNGNYTWGTGDTLSYTAWDAGEPTQPCVKYQNTKWKTGACTEEINFVCQVPQKSETPCSRRSNPTCLDGFTAICGSCYKLVEGSSMNWGVARAECGKYAARLADLVTQAESEAVATWFGELLLSITSR